MSGKAKRALKSGQYSASATSRKLQRNEKEFAENETRLAQESRPYMQGVPLKTIL